MFKIQKSDTFKWPVSVNVPVDNGRFQTYEFTGEFKLHEQSKIDQLLERFRNDDHDFVVDLLVGWSGVQAADGNDLPYNDDNKRILLDIPYVRTAVTKAYFEASTGNKQKK